MSFRLPKGSALNKETLKGFIFMLPKYSIDELREAKKKLDEEIYKREGDY